MSSGALGASIKVGESTHLGRGMTLRVERSENHGTDLYGVFLRVVSRNGRTIAAAADRGTFLATVDPDVILFRLTNGKSWTISKIPGSTPGNFDPWVDIGPKGTIYFGYTDGNGHAYVAVSRDHGANWSAPFDVGAAQNVQNSEFASSRRVRNSRSSLGFD